MTRFIAMGRIALGIALGVVTGQGFGNGGFGNTPFGE